VVPTDPFPSQSHSDKIDTLVGFWAIDESRQGSKDPYALREPALGVIRLVLENDLRIALYLQFGKQFRAASKDIALISKIDFFRRIAVGAERVLEFNRYPFMRGFS